MARLEAISIDFLGHSLVVQAITAEDHIAFFPLSLLEMGRNGLPV